MGVYLYVRVPNKAIRERVLAFMQEHHHPLFPNSDPLPPPQAGGVVCAYAKPNDVGFYYGAGCDRGERAHIYGLIRWMALRVGSNRYYYEGQAKKVVVRPWTEQDWFNEKADIVDEVGFAPSTGMSLEEANDGSDSIYSEMARQAHQADAAIHAELKRLSILWDKVQFPP